MELKFPHDLKLIVKSLECADYECSSGYLNTDIAFIALKEMAEDMEGKSIDTKTN